MYGVSGGILDIKKLKIKSGQDIPASNPAVEWDGFHMRMVIWSAMAAMKPNTLKEKLLLARKDNQNPVLPFH
jgi:hypothetical protein